MFNNNLLLDMDGVTVDFKEGLFRAHGKRVDFTRPENKDRWDIWTMLGMDREECFQPLLRASFWAELPKTSDCDDLFAWGRLNFGEDHLAFCTDASNGDGAAVQGKTDWVAKHYPKYRKRIIFTAAKDILATPTNWLMDDRNENIDEFEAAGGHGILVPRPWNRMHHLTGLTGYLLKRTWEVN
jgi:phosphoglycolate phosphatase-like HAD superfamily hydrolase